jgi:hypothetical protein
MPFQTPQNSPTYPPPAAAKSDFEKMIATEPKLDDLLAEFNQPRQDFTPPPPPETTSGFFNSPEQQQHDEPENIISPEEAKTNGRNAAKMLDTGISFALKMFARDDSAADYKASPEEISEMAEPLSELSEKYNFKISPEIILIFLIITIYMPKYFIASERRQIALEQKQTELEARLKNVETKKSNSDEND